MSKILELDQLEISFGGNYVLNGVSLDLNENEFLSVIGPNGAGKTTLFQIIGGQYQTDHGKIFFSGSDITHLDITERSLAGIGRTFQKSSLYFGLSVEENIALSVRVQKQLHSKFQFTAREKQQVSESVDEVLEILKMPHQAQMKAGDLGHADQRKLELGILLGMKPRLMLLDEPAAGMAVEEIPLLMEILETLKQSKRYSIILVEHKIDLVLALSDRVAVLHNGSLLADESPFKIQNNPDVQKAYLGIS